MSDKSVFYIVIAFILIVLSQCVRDITIEFIKSSNENNSAIPQMFMVPQNMLPDSAPSKHNTLEKSRNFALN